MKIMVDFCIIVLNFRPILMQKERKRNETVPFCVPLILEASVPASFLSDFRGIRSCLVPQKKERVPERVLFGTRSCNALLACLAQFRIPLGMVPLIQNFRSLGCVTAVRRAPKVFDKRYIRSNFQSCH